MQRKIYKPSTLFSPAQYVGLLRPYLHLTLMLTAHLEHPTIRQWAETLMEERRQLWDSRGKGDLEREGLQGVTVGSVVDARDGANGH